MADFEYDAMGVITVDTSTLRTEIETEYRAALGADLVTDPSTPQGVLITGEVIARTAVLDNNAAIANQINPNLAGGVFLDAIGALTQSLLDGGRIAATRSVISDVELTGLPGVVIPSGSQASTADGLIFESVSGVTLDGSGDATVDFQALDAGPIAVNSGALSQVVTSIYGWDAVDNPNAATVGRNVESDIAYRMRRKNTLASQGIALPEAIASLLYNTPNVRSLTFRENVTNATATIDGVSLVEHSIFVCVDGGTDNAVAAALLAKKSLGCNWNGTTTVNVVDSVSGQTYPVKFQRPTAVPILARVTVRNIGSAVADVTGMVRAAILSYANGLIDGERGFVVGGSASPFELSGAVLTFAPGLYVQKVELSLVSSVSYSTNEIAIGITEIATINSGSIGVIVL